MAQNARLLKRVQRLEKEIANHQASRVRADRHSSNSTGTLAEDYVCKLLGGKATERNADHDLVIGRRRFEIKGSKCNMFYSGVYSYTRWTWHNFLGIGSKKTFHRLILVGEADPAHRSTYRDPRSPYVIFDVPVSFAKEVAASRARYGSIFTFQLISHRDGAKTSALCKKMWDYEVTRSELKDRYRT